jgi:spore germination protein GerM
MRIRLIAALLAVALATAGCGISADTTPRDIDQTADAGLDPLSGQAAVGSGRIFLAVPDATGVPTKLTAVSRDVDDSDPEALLQSLLAGPNAIERANDVTTTLPADVQLLGWIRRPGGVLSIDLSESFAELNGQTLIVALAQILYTVSDIGGTEGVRITVAGEQATWPDINGQLHTDPLTVFDYPGLLPSSQPEFPATPSG